MRVNTYLSDEGVKLFNKQFAEKIREGRIQPPARPPILDKENWEIWSLWELFEGSMFMSAHGYPMPGFKDFIYVCEWLGYRKHAILENWDDIRLISTLIHKKLPKANENDKGGGDDLNGR